MKSTESLAIPRKWFSMVRILSQIHPSLMRKSGARVLRLLKMDKQSSAEHVEHPKKSLDNPGISDGSGRFAVDQMADEASQVPAAVSHNSRSNILTMHNTAQCSKWPFFRE